MIQVYADDRLVYDSRLEALDLLGLDVTTGLNVGGTATIVMPVGHPAYNYFTSYKTIVTIYRDGVLRFRGRALYPADNFLGDRTITCEGELCFLRDSINRPYLYQASPRSIFVTLINIHNAQQTDPIKQFKVGEVTVVDDNDYVRLESESAQTVLDTLNKAVERCGGYVTFTINEDGERVINWLADMGAQSAQVIEFGENLLDFTSTGANTENLATGLVPYGAQDEVTKKRVTIESVNGGKDYILADDAVAERGIIMATHTWDDVTLPSNLLKKARAYLNNAKLFITSLELTALDLSYLDKSVDSFTVGDFIRVVSVPHGVNDDFQLTQMTEDLLNPANSTITLGKDVLSLTCSEVADKTATQSALGSVQVQVNQAQDLSGYVTSDQLADYATTETLAAYVPASELVNYATKNDLEDLATSDELSGYATKTSLTQEVNNRKALIALVSGATDVGDVTRPTNIKGSEVNIGDEEHVTHLYGGDRIKVHSRMHFLDGMLDFANNIGIRAYNTDGNVYYILRVDSDNNTFVGNDTNKTYLRGSTVYLKNSGAVVTSDKRKKHSVEALPDAYVDMLDKLTPVRFKYTDGKSDRFHVGFIAQDVEQALTDAGLSGKDFGGFVDVNGDGSELGLAYDEFIGLLFEKIRRLEERLKVLEDDSQ